MCKKNITFKILNQAGNQSTNVPIANPNILWGAAAAATLGATLAEWQRRREEEEAARRAAMFSGGGGDEEEEASDVSAKKRAKVMAKNQAKRNQEQAWENARMENQREQAMQAHRQGEKDAVAIAQAYQAKKAMDAQREGERNAVSIAEEYKAREREKQNDVYAARWAGLASVAREKQDGGSGKALAMPAKNYEPPWWDKLKQTWEDVKIWTDDHVVQPVKEWAESKIEQTWPAIRATGPGENGINLVNKYRDIIIGTVSSFNSLIKTNGSIPYTYEYTNIKGRTIQEQQEHSVLINPTSLAISMSVQAEAPGFIDFFQWLFSPVFDSPSFGMAQVPQSDYKLLRENIEPYTNLHGISPIPFFALQNTHLSTSAMIERIAPSVEVCQEYKCTPTDQEIIVGVNQNGDGGFSKKDLRNYFENEAYRSIDDTTLINWPKVFNERTIKDGGRYEDFLNWRASGHNYDTWFMLNRYYNNAMAFKASGEWTMPEGVDWGYIKSLIENTPPSNEWK